MVHSEAIGAAIGAEVGRFGELGAGVEALEEDRVRIEFRSGDKAVMQDPEDECVYALGEDGEGEELGRCQWG
jgi:hypothetical protein